MPTFYAYATDSGKIDVVKVSNKTLDAKQPPSQVKADNNIAGEFLSVIITSTKANAKATAKEKYETSKTKREAADRRIWKERDKQKPNKQATFISHPNLEKKEEKLTLPKVCEESKAIYCDFNGVLDKTYDTDLIKAIDVDKAMKLVHLAFKHNAQVICISLHRIHTISDYASIIRLTVRASENQEYIQFINDNKSEFMRLFRTEPTPVLSDRSTEVYVHLHDHGFSHHVVFEDDHFIDPILNPIRPSSTTGLLPEHFEAADLILSKPFTPRK